MGGFTFTLACCPSSSAGDLPDDLRVDLFEEQAWLSVVGLDFRV